jgi:hypothetical protein
MDNTQIKFIKTDDNTIVNENWIRWVKKWGDCLEVCSKANGCCISIPNNTHKICKQNNLDSYMYLNKYFE